MDYIIGVDYAEPGTSSKTVIVNKRKQLLTQLAKIIQRRQFYLQCYPGAQRDFFFSTPEPQIITKYKARLYRNT